VWELWDVESGNIINTYPTEQAALAVVREAHMRHGRQYVQNWALGQSADDDDSNNVIEGDSLIEQAEKSFATPG
jgi:hypothetical protein